jgi:hypothetical protein
VVATTEAIIALASHDVVNTSASFENMTAEDIPGQDVDTITLDFLKEKEILCTLSPSHFLLFLMLILFCGVAIIIKANI